MKNRTILIGLDGATFTILNPLLHEGVMPFLKQVVESGARAELRSVVPPVTPPAWTSLMTGRSPGHHGIFDFFLKESPDSQHIRFATSHDVACEMIWTMVNRHGLRATSLNFPLMFPPPPIDGYVVPGGWMPWRQLRLGCHPAGLYDRLKMLPGLNARELALDMAHEEKAIEGCQHDEYEPWIEFHIRREQHWFDILRHLMSEDPCELTAILFDGVDKIQHLCWRFLDPAYVGELRSPWEQRVRALCLEYFRQLDQLLAEIARLAGPDATLVLASDHGFGATTEVFYVNTWLQQQGCLAWAEEPGSKGDKETLRQAQGDARRQGDVEGERGGEVPLSPPLLVPPSPQHPVTPAPRLGMGQLARHVYLLDWERTLAYAPSPSSNGIHIVVAGRDGDKGVPEADYERFRGELIAALRRFTDPVTGEPVVAHVWTRDEVFAGPHVGMAPDLTLALRDGGPVSILASDAPLRPRPEPAGAHRPEGIFIAKGPGMRQGAVLSPLLMLDMAPLLLYSLGLPIPGSLEGRVPTEALEPAALQIRPVQMVTGAEPPVREPTQMQTGPVLDEEAEAEILRRLQALGYIE